MGDSKLFALVRSIASEALELDVRKEDVAEGIWFDGGVETSGLKVRDILMMIEESRDETWDGAAFAFEEMMFCYAEDAESLTDMKLVRAVTTALLLANAIRREHRSWDNAFDYCLKLVCKNMRRMEFDHRMKYFEFLLRGDYCESW